MADLDFTLITKRKRMMDSVGHYARPDLLGLTVGGVPMVMGDGPGATGPISTTDPRTPPA